MCTRRIKHRQRHDTRRQYGLITFSVLSVQRDKLKIAKEEIIIINIKEQN